MSVGLGALHPGWIAFEADEGRAARARKLDESLAIYAGLLGDPATFTYAGRYYSAGANDFMLPPPTPQRPHPPVWVVGAPTPGGGRQRSLERAARWQGLIPAIHAPDGRPKTVEAFAAVVEPVRRLRAEQGLPWEGYDVVIEADSWGAFTSARARRAGRVGAGGGDVVDRELVGRAQGGEGLAEVRRRVGRARRRCAEPLGRRWPRSAVAWRYRRVHDDVCHGCVLPRPGRTAADGAQGRLVRFMLPGGKIDPGESLAEAAVREVMEEVGLDVSGLGERLGRFHDVAANEPDAWVDATVYVTHLRPDDAPPRSPRSPSSAGSGSTTSCRPTSRPCWATTSCRR